MTNKMYDTLKMVALIGAPVIVFLSTLLAVWNVPYQTELTATLAAIDTLLGALVTALKSKYDKENEETEEN